MAAGRHQHEVHSTGTLHLERRYDYSLIPDVSTKVIFPRDRDSGVSYCRMLLHDTILNDDGYRSGNAETRMCSCAEDNETVEHFLF